MDGYDSFAVLLLTFKGKLWLKEFYCEVRMGLSRIRLFGVYTKSNWNP